MIRLFYLFTAFFSTYELKHISYIFHLENFIRKNIAGVYKISMNDSDESNPFLKWNNVVR